MCLRMLLKGALISGALLDDNISFILSISCDALVPVWITIFLFCKFVAWFLFLFFVMGISFSY